MNTRSCIRSTKSKKGNEARKECHLGQALYLEFRRRAILGVNNPGIQFIDYEVPVSDGRRGAIDLLGYAPISDRLYFFELKFNDKKKVSILRCILEELTYYKKIVVKKFLSDFNAYDKRITSRTSITIAPLYVQGGYQDQEWRKLRAESSLVALIRKIKSNGIDVEMGILSQRQSTVDVSKMLRPRHILQ